jgi:cytochrome c-type biogenesis protein
MAETALAVQLLLAFGGGVVSFLSPCVLPLLPGYLSMMSGYSVAELESGKVSGRRMLRVVGLFVLGFTLVFAVLGATATGLGRFLAQNQTVIDRVAGALIIGFGLMMAGMAVTNRGFFGVVNQERRFDVRPSRLGAMAPPVMGMAFGFGWTPCIGPILSVVLATAATRQTVTQGVALLVAYSLGLGVPFLAAGLGLRRGFRRVRRFLRPIMVGSGLVMAAFGLVMVSGNIGRMSGFFADALSEVPLLGDLARI